MSNSLLQKSETIKPNNCQRGIFACKIQERVSKDEIDFEVHNLQNPPENNRSRRILKLTCWN